MQQQFLNHIQRHSLCKTTDKILLAVSGGVDSLVMLHLFRRSGFPVGVAHCNFKLRGHASDLDEEHVRSLCEQVGIAFHSTSFDTNTYAVTNRMSVQMAARELRYRYFQELMQHQGYDWVATAHHANDNLETVLLNIVRGTGASGISGIPVKVNRIIRPLLFASRADIESYARENKIDWREDASNDATDYHRNLIRHEVIPVLKQINPDLEHTFESSLERIAAIVKLGTNSLEEFFSKNVQRHSDGTMVIDRESLVVQPDAGVLLWEYVKQYGFNYSQCSDIIGAAEPGKRIISSTHEIYRDRGSFFLRPHSPGRENNIVALDASDLEVRLNGAAIHAIRISPTLPLTPDQSIAYLDFDQLTFPLRWRPWREGDSFVPLGMKGHKKVSDFLVDNKIPLHEKSLITVLESGDKIVWIVGMRIDDRFKVGTQTREILRLSWTPSHSKKIS